MIEKSHAVFFENSAVICGIIRQLHDFLPTLDRRHKEHQREDTDDKPRGNRHLNDHAAADGTQQITRGHDQHIHQHHVLEPERVRRVERRVEHGHPPQMRMQPKSASQRKDQRDQSRPPSQRNRQVAGGNRPMALLGMQAVVLAVEDVVEQIDAAAQQDEAESRA